jgi:hypothetical protein
LNETLACSLRVSGAAEIGHERRESVVEAPLAADPGPAITQETVAGRPARDAQHPDPSMSIGTWSTQ